MTDELVKRLILRAREFERATDFGGKMFEDAQRRLDEAREAAIAVMPRIEALVEALRDIASIDRAFVEANGIDGALGKIIDRALTALQGWAVFDER